MHGRSHAQRRPGAQCRTLLRRMAPEHKFATAARLCSEVLAGFADGVLSLGAAPEVLRDALHILASKDIKVALPLGHAPSGTPSVSFLAARHLPPSCSVPPGTSMPALGTLSGVVHRAGSPSHEWSGSQVDTSMSAEVPSRMGRR